MIRHLYGSAVTRFSTHIYKRYQCWGKQFCDIEKYCASVNLSYPRRSLRCFSTSLAEKEAVGPRDPTTIRNTAIIAHVDVSLSCLPFVLKGIIWEFANLCLFWIGEICMSICWL